MSPAEPAPERIEGPAFTRLVKGLAHGLMALLVITGARSAELLIADRRHWLTALVMLLLAAVAILCYWWMLNSRTTVSATHLRQTWWKTKQVAIADITQTKLILVPGLTWLIAPRLVVSTREPGTTVFHAAEPRLIAAFARLSIGLPALP